MIFIKSKNVSFSLYINNFNPDFQIYNSFMREKSKKTATAFQTPLL